MDTPKLKHYIILYGLISIIVTTICCTSCIRSVSKLPHDSFLEEIFEDVVEDNTGIKADITGSSPEKSHLQIDVEQLSH